MGLGLITSTTENESNLKETQNKKQNYETE